MAYHSISVINKGSGASEGSSGQQGNSVHRTGKVTSIKSQIQQKNNLGRNILKGIKIGRTLNVGAGVGMLGGGAAMAVAVAQEVSQGVQQGVNIYASVMEAKTGETMRYHNLRQGVSMITNPISYVKQYVWQRGVMLPMQVNRQNEMLEYNRQLTGNVIHSKSHYNTLF